MTYTAAKHPHAPNLWIAVVTDNGERAIRGEHYQTRRAAQEAANWLNEINAPMATMTGRG